MSADRNPAGVRARLRAALTDALKARDIVSISALRSAIAAVDNAATAARFVHFTIRAAADCAHPSA
jgi:uncharacterized protein YqeY